MSSVVLLRAVSPSTRALLCGLAVLGVLARVMVVIAAMSAAHGDAERATIFAVGASAAWLAHRLLNAHARVGIECELYRTITRALLDTDVLSVPAFDLQRAVFDASHHARGHLVQSLPALVADFVALIVLLPIILVELPARVVVLAVVVLGVVGASLALVRLATRGLHERVNAASDRVYADVLRAVEGRLEIVARGGEEEHAAQLDRRLREYAHVARRANLRAAALGRLPVALAIAAIIGVAVVDAAMRRSLEATVVGQAVILGASAPIVLGLVVGISELGRSATQIRPLLLLLSTPPRDDLRRRGATSPSLPARIDGRDVAFGYGDGDAKILEDVTFRWSPKEPLVIVGPNGAGKSTLLRLLIALRAPSRGEVTVGDLDLATADVVAMRRDVAYLPQRPYLGEPYTTLREALRSGRASANDDEMLVVLARVGLAGRSLDDVLGELSAGQRQRLALARALVQRASLVILDEPDANLDREGVALVRALMTELLAAGSMVAVAAHTNELADMEGVRVTLGPRARTEASNG